MTTEELKLKVSIDTSGLQQDVAKVKSSLKGAEDSLSGKGIQNGAKVTSESLGQVRDELDKIRNLQFADMILENFDGIRKGTQALTSSIKLAGSEIGGIFSLEHFKNTESMGEAFESMGIQAKESIKSLKHGTKSFYDSLGQAMGGMSGAMAMTVASLAVVLVQVLAIVAATKMAIQNAQAVAQMSREAAKIGMSVHAYEEWGYILKQNGIEVDKLSDFLKTLAAEQNAVREGSEDTIKAFERLGLSASEVSNMSQQELFEKTVAGLQNVENQVERTGLAYKIFGEDDAANLIPILSMNNQELEQMRRNYELLGGAASQTLVQRSQQLQNSLSNMSTAWQGVKNAITEALLPAIIAVVNWFTKAIAVIGMFFRAILGTDTKHADKSTASMSSGMGSYTTAVDGATKAVQKLKREQMGFDELNVLPGKDSSSGGSGGGGGITSTGGGMGDMNIPTVEDMGLGKIQDWFNKYKTTIQDITTWSLIGIGTIGCVIALLTGNIPAAIMFAGVAGLGVAIGSVEGGTFDRIGDSIFKWYDTKLKPWWNNKVKPIFTKAFWKQKWDTLTKATGDALDNVSESLSKDFSNIKKWFDKTVKPVFTKKYWQDKWGAISSAATEKLQAVKTAVSTKWDEVKKWFKTNVADKFTKKYWQTKFDGVRAGIADKVSAAKKSCTDAWSSIKTWFNKSVAPKFTKKYWQGKFDTIKSGAKASFNGIIGIVESALNKIINKINTLSWKIPDWVPSVGGSKFGFNFKTISIPRLATGGIATRSTLANIGEAGAEAVLPLENNTGWMDKLADKIASRSGGPGKLVLNVDGKTLGWVAIDNINQITKQTGEIPLAI